MHLHVHVRTYCTRGGSGSGGSGGDDDDDDEDDGEDKDTRHLCRDSCNVATDARGRGRERAEKIYIYTCMCGIYICMCVRVYGQGVAAPARCRSPVVNLLSLYFRNWRTWCDHSSARSLFDFQPSRAAAVAILPLYRPVFFALRFPLFFPPRRNFYRDYYRATICTQSHARLFRAANNSTPTA